VPPAERRPGECSALDERDRGEAFLNTADPPAVDASFRQAGIDGRDELERN
jgi:hypothetical protein